MTRIRRAIPALVTGLVLVVVLAPPAPAQEAFVRGDVDGSRSFTVLDAVHTLHFLFGAEAALPCADAADFDDSGTLELTDAVSLLNLVFLDGAEPAAPFPLCGVDATASDLDCTDYPACVAVVGGFPLVEDGIFWVVDRSGSMQASGELGVVKQEIIESLEVFPESHEFGIVFSDAGVMKFPASGAPSPATDAIVAAAIAWTTGIAGGSGSCPQQGLAAAFDMARASIASRKAIIYVGDGGGTCRGARETDYLAETLELAQSLDRDDIVVHTIGVLAFGQIQADFLRDLAALTGGRYVRVDR